MPNDAPNPVASERAGRPDPPRIPDHELLRVIGAGAYGEVWLARTVLGEFRAVKVVRRDEFGADQRPFEREFEGIRRYEPISRSDPSQVAILHVGRAADESCFYYVMELADAAGDEGSAGGDRLVGQPPRPMTDYSPHTLRSDLQAHGRLPAARVVELGLALSHALAHLHRHKLVHRDVKPANIIFVGGRPKLADIGLVTHAAAGDDARSIVGTEGYLPPEGPGTPQADLFALGRVLYEALTGLDRRQYPDLPAGLREWPDRSLAFELNEIVLRACATDTRERYSSADAIHADLARLQAGKSVKRRQAWRRLGRLLGLVAMIVAVVTLVVLGTRWAIRHNPTRSSSGDLFETSGTHSREAYTSFRLGQALWKKDAWESLTNAVSYFDKAIVADPKFARAYVGLADCYEDLAEWFVDPRPMMDRQRTAVLKALAVDDRLAEAHSNLGVLKRTLDWDWTGAEAEFKRSIELDPHSAMAHKRYAEHLAGMNRAEEAKLQARLAIEANPDWAEARDILAYVFYCAREFDQAIELLRESGTIDKDYAVTYSYLSEFYSRMGRFEEAADARLKAVEVHWAGRVSDDLTKYRDAHRRGGWMEIQRFLLNRLLAAPEVSRDEYLLACTHLRLGNTEAALDWLERAADHRARRIREIGGDPTFDPLRTEPRFHAILRKMGLEK